LSIKLDLNPAFPPTERVMATDTPSGPAGRERTAFGRWMLFWLGAPVLGIANGALRQAAYTKRLGELRAHQLSTATLVALLGTYVAALDRRAPIARAGDAALIGAAWAAMTVEFELAFGHLRRPRALVATVR
jgi:lysylphosphatidylglycerol synthetase-like protein (DUF2156 family)